MKQFFSIIILMSFISVNGQNDTIFYEGFENFDFEILEKIPTGKNLGWINWDIDQKEPGEALSSSWYRANEIYQAQVTMPAVYNQTAHSISYLKDLSLDSRNVLISPPIMIKNNKSTLSWKSCPLQGPVFMDGYKVLISVTSNDITKAKPDTVFVAAEVTSYLDPATLNLGDYTFSKGYIHANGYTKSEYFDTTGVSSFYRGKLEPHTVSLEKYAGKTIYIHFVHDSGDDYILEIDDILVKANEISNTENETSANIELTTFPNPVETTVNLSYSLDKSSDVEISLMDVNGTKFRTLTSLRQAMGKMKHEYTLTDIPGGTYILQVRIEDEVAYKKIVKN